MPEKASSPAGRWILPVITFIAASGAGLGWKLIDPHSAALRFQAGRTASLARLSGLQSIQLPERMHDSLLVFAALAALLAITNLLVACLRPHLRETAAVFTCSVMVYALSAFLVLGEQSGAPHYVYLADAFAHGRLVLEEEPPESEQNDWTYYDGQWMVSFPPMPALLMTPIAVVSGTDINDVLFTLIFAGLNTALFHDLLPAVGRRLKNRFETSPAARLGLTLAFSFGTVHWWLACFGQVWFTAQIMAVTFLLLAIRETLLAGRPLLVGLWLACSALSRPPILLALPVFAWLLADSNGTRRMLQILVAPAVAGMLLGWYNFARFVSPFELGYRYMLLEDLLAEVVGQYGSFNLVFLKTNLYHAFLNLPELQAEWPFVVMDGWGMSMLISTPLLLVLVRAPWREKWVLAAGMGAFLVAAPSLLYYNTGYLQAGYRYALDFLPLLFLAVAASVRGKMNTATWILTGASIVMGFLSLVNFYGFILD